jgi:hypothetical protein
MNDKIKQVVSESINQIKKEDLLKVSCIDDLESQNVIQYLTEPDFKGDNNLEKEYWDFYDGNGPLKVITELKNELEDTYSQWHRIANCMDKLGL